MELNFTRSPFEDAVSPAVELAAYEALWDQQGASFKTIAEKFRQAHDVRPSDLVQPADIREYAQRLESLTSETGSFGVRVNGAGEYPKKLRDATYPVELLYFQGWWDLINSPCVAIVGSREASDEGVRRARRLAFNLVKDGYTVVSGLAKGIDTAAHKAAIEAKGRTIAVIGTPLNQSYPKENEELQSFIKENFLLISPVPFCRYSNQTAYWNRNFFPERNKVMSALTEATIIVEAGETSGTLVQARSALQQKRKLFILDSCFKNPDITWPKSYEAKGAIRVSDYEDIRKHLKCIPS